MLSKDKVIAIYCMLDDLLKMMGYQDDKRRKVSDAEVITTAVVSAMYFGGHYERSLGFMKCTGMIPKMLEKSRFCRRLHKVSVLMYDLFLQIGKWLKEFCCTMKYVLDSFPVAVCDNIRISRCKILRGEQWRGYTASMRRYFYGVKVQLLITEQGVPVEFCFVPGKESDAKALEQMDLDVPPESEIYSDSAFTNYEIEDMLKEQALILLKTQRKSNSKRPDTLWDEYIKEQMRKPVETSIGEIKKLFPRTIHAITKEGFLLKIMAFIFAIQIRHLIN